MAAILLRNSRGIKVKRAIRHVRVIGLKKSIKLHPGGWRGRNVEKPSCTKSMPILNFYMRKNTPERKDYIMDQLVVPVEE